jgi:pimeloyl-ACP methyl ester carboxylesterase
MRVRFPFDAARVHQKSSHVKGTARPELNVRPHSGSSTVRRRSWRRSWKRVLLTLLGLTVLVGGALGHAAYRASRKPPTSRLALDAFYPEMPADSRHHYVNLPLDSGDPSSALFRGFYILSPRFQSGASVVFFLTDGQMELVGPNPDFSFFEAELPGLSYVLIGHRGHSPTLFPEVYPAGKVDLRRAVRLYGSAQRVEDIERVRRDMVEQRLLPPDGRIMIFAASGAGVLAQQYLQRYGDHVSRVLLASTGAPDLAREKGWDYARRFAEFDSSAAADLGKVLSTRSVSPSSLTYLLFQLGRKGNEGRVTQRTVLRGLLGANPFPYVWYRMHPSLSWLLSSTILDTPAADAAKVRMYELLGADLQRYGSTSRPDVSLMYTWTATLLQEYLTEDVAVPELRIDRSRYQGDVLVVSGLDDVVFSPEIGKAIANAYPHGRFVVVRGGHRLEQDREYQRAIRTAFFVHGLHAPRTEGLLASPPVS